MAFQNYSIASGFNNAAGLANVETAFPTFQGKPMIVQGRTFNPGEKRRRADKLTYRTGFQIALWRIPVMSIAQYNYWIANFTTGGNSFSGKNTIKTKKVDDTYGDYSVVSDIPSPDELKSRGGAYRDVLITHVVEAAL